LPGPGRRPVQVRAVRRRPEADVGAFVAEVATRLRSGVSTSEAWDRTAQRWGLPAGVGDDGVPHALAELPPGAAVAGARAAARLAAELGSPLADMLDACADGLTRAEENEAARRIALAGPVASARLLAILPVVGVALGILIGADPLGQLLGGGVGSATGLAGVLLMGAGARWSRSLVAAARDGRL
ncbi:MAG: type II secretion system F family protein, partial [Actinomycetota bacterium]